MLQVVQPSGYKYNFKYYIFSFDLEAETWFFYRNHKPPTYNTVFQ